MIEVDIWNGAYEVSNGVEFFGSEEKQDSSPKVEPLNGVNLTPDGSVSIAIPKGVTVNDYRRATIRERQAFAMVPLIENPLRNFMVNFNRPLVGNPLRNLIVSLDRPLIENPLRNFMANINRPLVENPLKSIMFNFNRPPFDICVGSTAPLIDSFTLLSRASHAAQMRATPRRGEPFVARDFNRRAVRSRTEREIWSDLVAVEIENNAPVRERAYLLMLFDSLVTDVGLRQVCRGLFEDGYFAIAVQQAAVYIAKVVEEKSGYSDKSGAGLMQVAFSLKNPLLKMNSLQTKSESDEQQGYMRIFEGYMTGVRNPRAHEFDIEDSPEEALELLAMANHLMRKLNDSRLV